MGAGRAFSLSRVEAEEYFATNADRAATGTSNTGWHLRSMDTPTFGHFVHVAGDIIITNLSFTRGVRPAVWVSVN